MKRMMYRIFISLLFLGALPVMGLIAMLIAFIDGFPVFYQQRRMGYQNKPFMMVKFRTMKWGAENFQKKYARRNEAEWPVFKIREDPRFTSFGRVLSHTGLDELPQLINVMRGEMALFGPRPLPVAEVKKLKPWMQKRHDIKPGIISPWIFEGYHARPFNEWMESDIAYTKQKSLLFDLGLLGKAVLFVRKLFTREITSFVL